MFNAGKTLQATTWMVIMVVVITALFTVLLISLATYGFPCIVVCWFVGLFVISWAAPMAYGGSQARRRIGAVATSLCQSHSNTGSEPSLQPTPQLTATPDP